MPVCGDLPLSRKRKGRWWLFWLCCQPPTITRKWRLRVTSSCRSTYRWVGRTMCAICFPTSVVCDFMCLWLECFDCTLPIVCLRTSRACEWREDSGCCRLHPPLTSDLFMCLWTRGIFFLSVLSTSKHHSHSLVTSSCTCEWRTMVSLTLLPPTIT